jgi:hypothetical protein
MPPKWTTSHTFQVIIGAILVGLIAALTALLKDPTYAPWVQPILAVLVAVSGYLGITSGKGSYGFRSPKGPAIVILIGAGLCVRMLTACQPGTTVPPVVITDATCLVGWITVDLEHGMGLPAALADAATRCLGSASAENVARARSEYERANVALKAATP